MRIKILLALFLSTIIFSFNSKAEEKNETSSKPSLNYYYFDGWFLCSKITVIVNDLKKKHDKKIDIAAVKVGEGNSTEEIKKAKLKSHGIIAKDNKGSIITTVEGHSYGEEKVNEVIKLILKKTS